MRGGAGVVWAREIAGWVLLGVGLAAFAVCYLVFLLDRRGVSAAVLGFIGFVVFRGGLHLLKVAMAARAVQAGQVGALMLVGGRGHTTASLAARLGLDPAVRFHDRDDDIDAVAAPRGPFGQHLERLADAGAAPRKIFRRPRPSRSAARNRASGSGRGSPAVITWSKRPVRG